MPRRDRDRLADMLQAAGKAIDLAEGRHRGDLEEDETLALSLARLLEVLGEAASHVSEETRNRLDGIPWAEIVGMRNKLIHAYFDVDLDIVWQTVREDLPPLVEALEDAVDEDEA